MADRPTVTVRYRDAALRVLIGHAARQVEGVVELQRRSRAVVRRAERLVPGVDLHRAVDGILDVTVLVVCRLSPPPVSVIEQVTTAVDHVLTEAGNPQSRIDVVVADVRPANETS